MTTPEDAASAEEISWEAATRLLEGLSALPSAQRAGAIERLVRIPSPGIRERALRLGASLLPEARLVEHVRNDADATLRNAGLEMLKLRGARSFAVALRLLNDADEDVALQAILILDHLRDPRALGARPAALPRRRSLVADGCRAGSGRPALGARGAAPAAAVRRPDAELDRGRGGGPHWRPGGVSRARRALAAPWPAARRRLRARAAGARARGPAAGARRSRGSACQPRRPPGRSIPRRRRGGRPLRPDPRPERRRGTGARYAGR